MTQSLKNHKGIIITGPTACGKSSFAALLANRINGTIINADSQQVYKEIPIISASPLIELDLLKLAPHKLFGFCDGEKPLSASNYGTLANAEFEKALKNNSIPIFVGGTGFYLNTLVKGLSAIPEPDEKSRKKARDLANKDLESAYKELKKLDSETANRLNPNDKQRISRALEIIYATGKSLSYWQKQPLKPAIKAHLLKILILPNKELLRERIKSRIQIMLKSGALDEVRDIMNRKYSENLPIMKADGILELSKYIKRDISLDEAITEMEFKSIHYMKRQITYFKNSFDSDVILDHIPTPTDLP